MTQNNEPEGALSVSSVHELNSLMAQNNVVMIYEGEFNQEITKTVLSMTEKNFDSEGINTSVKKKVFNVMVEVLQNICKHQKTGEKDLSSIFMIGDDGDNLLIISGNPISNPAIEKVKSKIDLVNSCNKEELKKLYKEARLNSTLSDVGGAGLGFIDIARKSGQKIECAFDPHNNELSFFTLLIRVSKTESPE